MSNQLFTRNATASDVGSVERQAAFRLKLRRFIDDEVPKFSGAKRGTGRGIVTSTGGPFTAGSIVGLTLLRELGCRLPVEVWYRSTRGELSSVRDRDALKALGCELANADGLPSWQKVRKNDPRDGWRLKPFAILNSRFSEVIWRDADCYDVEDPTFLFDHSAYREPGALLWPDLPWEDLAGSVWRAFGVGEWDTEAMEGSVPAVESGQMIFDVDRHADALALSVFLNAESDFTYRHVWGDKETFPIALRLLKRPYNVISRRPDFRVHSLVQFAPAREDGSITFRPQTVHRARNKITFDPGDAGMFPNTGQYFRRFKFCPDLPREADVLKIARRVRRERFSPSEAQTAAAIEGQSYYVLSVFGRERRLIVLLPDGEFGEGAEDFGTVWVPKDDRVFVSDDRQLRAVLIRQPDGTLSGQTVVGNCDPVILRPLSRDAIVARKQK